MGKGEPCDDELVTFESDLWTRSVKLRTTLSMSPIFQGEKPLSIAKLYTLTFEFLNIERLHR